MALAAVVFLFARMKRIIVIANVEATATVLRSQRRRVDGTRSKSAAAAMPERSPATCQPLKATDLTATPPVENSTEADINRSRSDARCESIEVMARPGDGGISQPTNLSLDRVLQRPATGANFRGRSGGWRLLNGVAGRGRARERPEQCLRNPLLSGDRHIRPGLQPGRSIPTSGEQQQREWQQLSHRILQTGAVGLEPTTS